MKSTRLITTLNKKTDLYEDSEINLSSTSDNDYDIESSKSVTAKTSISEMTEPSNINCLICSILPSLSNVNCCSKHLELLTTSLPAPIVCTMLPQVHDWLGLECHCRSYCSKSKRTHRFRSLSLSSSSSKSRCQRKKRPITLSSLSTIQKNDFLLSPNRERSASPHSESRKRSAIHHKRRSNTDRTSLSPSLIMNDSNSQKRTTRTLSSPIVTKHKQRNINQIESTIQYEPNNQSTISNLVELDTDLLCIPRILLKRVIHVKDDDEELITNNSQITLNMAQATKQMITQENTHPKILLKRVCLEQ